MKSAAGSKAALDRALSGDRLIAWAGGDFWDKNLVPTRKAGVIGATASRVHFACKGLLGTKTASRAISEVTSARIGDFHGGGIALKGIREVTIDFSDGSCWRLGFLRGGDAEALIASLSRPSN